MRTVRRSEFLRIAAGAAGTLALGGPAAARARAPRFVSFRSRPDLRPPVMTVTGASAAQAQSGEGCFFLAPSAGGGSQAGPLIADVTGEPVWFHPLEPGLWASSFGVQRYRNEPVLTWWQGRVDASGYGQGEGVILDGSYRELARVRAGNGRHADLHELLLTPEGTALITCYPQAVP